MIAVWTEFPKYYKSLKKKKNHPNTIGFNKMNEKLTSLNSSRKFGFITLLLSVTKGPLAVPNVFDKSSPNCDNRFCDGSSDAGTFNSNGAGGVWRLLRRRLFCLTLFVCVVVLITEDTGKLIGCWCIGGSLFKNKLFLIFCTSNDIEAIIYTLPSHQPLQSYRLH